MKKISTFLIGLTFVSSTVFGQALIDEGFEGATFPPTGWTALDEDGRTPDPAYTLLGEWERLSLTGDGSFQAVSSAAYTPAGASDDWLISPSIAVPDVAGKSTLLSFIYASLSGNAPYNTNSSTLEIKVSTSGTATSDFTFTFPVAANTGPGQLQARSVDLSEFAGQSIYVAFRNITASGSLAAVIDNVVIDNVFDVGISLSSLTFKDYGLDGDRISITGVVRNTGADAITAYDVTWKGRDGVDNVANIRGVNIPAFSSAAFSHSVSYVVSGVGSAEDIQVTVSNPNGEVDPDDSDNSMTTKFAIQFGATTAKNALLEEFTTVPCGFCPDGADKVEEALENPGVIAIGLHACFQTDVMTIPEASELCSQFSSGAPTAMIDRFLFDGEARVGTSRGPISGVDSRWETYSVNRAAAGAPVSIDINGDYNSTTRAATIKISSSFVDFFPGDVRVSLAIVEDSVTGGSDYSQRNYYSNGGVPQDPNNRWNNFSDPVVGYVHRHVLRDMLPNTWGDVATNWNADFSQRALNSAYTNDFTFTLDNAWDETQVSVVAIVSRFGDGNNRNYEVLNAEQVKLSELIAVGINENVNLGDDLKIYPNPSSTVTNLRLRLQEANDVELTVFDITGKQLRYQDYGNVVAGPQQFSIDVADLANGFYFVNLRVGDETITRKISVNK